MELHSIEFVVLHAGHEVTIPIQLRLAVGSLAGLIAVLAIAPVFVFSNTVRHTADTATVLITRHPSPSISSRIAMFLFSGLALGMVFELTTVGLERVRPVIVRIAGLISLTDLVAVTLIATVVAGGLWFAAAKSPTLDDRRMNSYAVAIGILYGFVLLSLLSALYSYFQIYV